MLHTIRLASLVSVAACLFTGCSQGPATGLVTGEVTLDGKPLEKGHLEFTPVDGQGQTGGIQIAGGKFSGPIPIAKMRVKIHAPRVVKGTYQAYPGAPLEDDVVEALPARYHEKSDITLDVKRGKQEVKYDLQSK
jgi:hypothetical protein